jgi:hypothetical protein
MALTLTAFAGTRASAPAVLPDPDPEPDPLPDPLLACVVVELMAVEPQPATSEAATKVESRAAVQRRFFMFKPGL